MSSNAAADEDLYLAERQLDEFFRIPEVIRNINAIDRNKGRGAATKEEKAVFKHFKKLHPEITKIGVPFRRTLFEMRDKYVKRHPEYLQPEIDDEPLEKYLANPQSNKNEIKFDTSLTKKLIKLKTAKNFDQTYNTIELPIHKKDYYKNLVNNITLDELKQFREYQLKNVDKKMENARDSKLDKENKKLKILKVALENAENELQKKKIQRKIDKVKDIRNQKRLINDMNKNIMDENKKLNLQNTPLIDHTELSSYIPKKFIPLFVKNKNGPGYHRITGTEVQKLKNDPSGDYYDGYGIPYIDIFRRFNIKNLPYSAIDLYRQGKPEYNKINLIEKQGGSILGIERSFFKPNNIIGGNVKKSNAPTLTNTEMEMDPNGFFHP